MKKRWIAGALVAAAAFAALAGCGKGQPDDGKLFVYNWSYYIPEQVLRDFEKSST